MEPFHASYYPPERLDNMLLLDRIQAKTTARRLGLDWGRAYRTCDIRFSRTGGQHTVVVSWRIR